MRMKNFQVNLLLLSILALCGIAAADDLEKALNGQYKGQTYSLRYPLTKGSQEYDASGNLLTRGQNGPWTIFSRVRIKKLRLRRDKLVVETERVGYMFDQRQSKMMPLKINGSVRIEIGLKEPLTSAEQVHQALGNVFAFKREEFLAAVDPLWHQYVESHLEAYSDDGRDLRFKAHGPAAPVGKLKTGHGPQVPAEGPQPDANGVYRMDLKGMIAPVPLHTPDPEYTEWARREKITATVSFNVVIDEQGKVAKIWLARPAGYGLEENAVSTLKTWTFRPATKDNKPVKVLVSIEVSFNLY